MAFDSYFTIEELTEIANAIRAGLGAYNAATRAVLVGALPNAIADVMPDGAAPIVQLHLDLQFINAFERLTDGTVPMIRFLRMALTLGGASAAMDVVRDKLSRLESRTSGAPRVVVDDLPEVKERIIGGHDDMVSYGFMQNGLAVAKGVAKLEVPRFANGQPHMTGGSQTLYLGTGWIIGKGLLITNHHVINARNDGEAAASAADFKQQGEATVAHFDYDFPGIASTTVTLKQLVCSDPDLDYAVARLDTDRDCLAIARAAIAPPTSDTYTPVNVVQHPDGKPKRFGIRNNLVTGATARDLRYFTDTDGGSSGSTVLDDDWKVVALHRGATFAKGVKYQGRETAYVNLGTQIHAILADIRTRAQQLAAELGLR